MRDWEEKRRKQDKKARRREREKVFLGNEGILFTEHNEGLHLVIQHSGITVDFWPGTGRWIPRMWALEWDQGVGGAGRMVAWLRSRAKGQFGGDKPTRKVPGGIAGLKDVLLKGGLLASREQPRRPEQTRQDEEAPPWMKEEPTWWKPKGKPRE